MHHRVDASQAPGQRCTFDYVTRMNLRTVTESHLLHMLGSWVPSQNANGMPGLLKTLENLFSDKSRRSGDENFHTRYNTVNRLKSRRRTDPVI
jgi:hypothetical protein